MKFNKFLLPLDGSELAETALAPVLALAEAMLAKVFFIRVAIPLWAFGSVTEKTLRGAHCATLVIR